MESILSESVEKRQEQEKEEKAHIRRILVPIDGSKYSMRAAKYAIEVAKLQKAQIVCIHVIVALPYGYAFSGSCNDQYLDDIENQYKLWFNQVIQMAEKEGIKNIKTEVFKDVRSITDAIINYASNNSIDLIVVGTRGRTGLQKVLIGSVANGIVQHAHCSVLLIR
jgi:nucleotide-binding universal stress UspA family protein